MALLRSIWVVAVSMFELNFGSGDKWWAWAVVFGAVFVVGYWVGGARGAEYAPFVFMILPLMFLSAIGVALRRRKGSPTQVMMMKKRQLKLQGNAP